MSSIWVHSLDSRQASKVSHDGEAVDRHGRRRRVSTGDVLQDGESLRRPLSMMDSAALPVGSVALADGSIRRTFSDGTAVVTLPCGHRSYLDQAGYPARSLSRLQLVDSLASGGATAAVAVSDAVVLVGDALGAREAARRRMAQAWRG